MKRKRFLVWLLAVGSLAAPPLRADRIELKTGEVLYGTILRVNAEEVSIELESGGILSFRRHRLRSIRQRGQPEVLMQPAPTTPPTPADRPPQAPGAQPGSSTAPRSPTTPEDRRGTTPSVEAGASAATAEAFPEHGVSLVVPKGFRRWPEGESEVVQLAWRDPITLSSCTLSIHHSEQGVRELKDRALEARRGQMKGVKVHRDLSLPVTAEPGQDPLEGWIVETESQIGGLPIRQVQLFARRAGRVAVLTLTTASDDAFLRQSPSFEEAVQSLRLGLAPASLAPAPAAE